MFKFHDFKAVTFVFPREQFPTVTSLDAVVKLFPPDSISDLEFLKPTAKKTEVAKAIFYSKQFYPRNPDLKKEMKIKRNGITQYKYAIYILVDSFKSPLNCTIGVAFSSLGREVFSLLHQRCGASRPLFRKLVLTKALGILHSGVSKQSRIAVKSLEVPLDTDDNVDRLWLAGRNVVSSVAYTLLPEILDTLNEDTHENTDYNIHDDAKYKPERCQFSYEDDLGASFKLTADNLGNIAFRVGKSHVSLSCIFELFRFFREHGATDDVKAWPWRGGSTQPADPDGEDEQ